MLGCLYLPSEIMSLFLPRSPLLVQPLWSFQQAAPWNLRKQASLLVLTQESLIFLLWILTKAWADIPDTLGLLTHPLKLYSPATPSAMMLLDNLHYKNHAFPLLLLSPSVLDSCWDSSSSILVLFRQMLIKFSLNLQTVLFMRWRSYSERILISLVTGKQGQNYNSGEAERRSCWAGSKGRRMLVLSGVARSGCFRYIELQGFHKILMRNLFLFIGTQTTCLKYAYF